MSSLSQKRAGRPSAWEITRAGYEYRRTERAAPERITVLLDDYDLSYDQIEKALDAIIHNHGQEEHRRCKAGGVRAGRYADKRLSVHGRMYVRPTRTTSMQKQVLPDTWSLQRAEAGIWTGSTKRRRRRKGRSRMDSREQSRETAYLMETSDGFLVRVPEESRLEAWEQAQKEAEAPLTPSEQRVKDKILSMIYGENR